MTGKYLSVELRRNTEEVSVPPRSAEHMFLNKTRAWGGVRYLDHQGG